MKTVVSASSFCIAAIAGLAIPAIANAQPLGDTQILEAANIRSGVRGDDIIRVDDGFLIVGWAPGEIEKPYIALLDQELNAVVWEKFPVFPNGALLLSATKSGPTGDYYASGFARHEGIANYDPLVLRLNKNGEVTAKWHPALGRNHTLWDILWDEKTGDIITVGETDYHQENSMIYAARLSADLELKWDNAYVFDSDRVAAYAVAPAADGFILAGGSSMNDEDAPQRFPALLNINARGEALDRKLLGENPDTIYHWIRSEGGKVYVGGYGKRPGREDNDVFIDIVNGDGERKKSGYAGWSKADHAIHSILCDGQLYLGGFTQSFSEEGWRGLLMRREADNDILHPVIVKSGPGPVAIRNLGCDEATGEAVFVGFRRDANDGVELIAGRAPR